jgi:hypothetical protein
MIGIILVHANKIFARTLHPCEALMPAARFVGHIDYSNPQGAVERAWLHAAAAAPRVLEKTAPESTFWDRSRNPENPTYSLGD